MRTFALFLLMGVTVWTPAGASPQAVALAQAIEQADWQLAHQAYAATSPAQSVATLGPLASSNVVMAQWFLADALARQGRSREASQWLYTASIGTRMDASICKIKAANTVEFRFIEAFSASYTPLRTNAALRKDALLAAVAFHGRQLEKSARPDWVCKLVAREMRRPPKRISDPSDAWQAARQRVFSTYKRQTGLDFSRSPDLFRIRPAGL